jgi:pimeloyl-ACP methyl ester carboxylesterase
VARAFGPASGYPCADCGGPAQDWSTADPGSDDLRVRFQPGPHGPAGHSAAGDLAVLYAAAHPQRVAHLILLTPGLRAVGIEESDEQWRAALARRSGEPWYAGALAAVEKAEAGGESAENRRAYMPFLYGRWDDAARAHTAGRLTYGTTAETGRPRRLSAETKPAFKTTEFWTYIAAVAAVLIASAVVGTTASHGDYFRADRAWLYIVILTVGYLASRGLAKSGSRQPSDG